MALQEEGDDYTKDGTVDLRGNPVRRSQRGRWKACSFVIVYEMFERMAYYGISSNLVIFMTTKLHQGTVQSSNNVTNWVGTIFLTPILGAYVADAHLGRYLTFVISSAICFLGMLVLTLSVSIPGMKPPECSTTSAEDCEQASVLQLALFFGALYILAFGTGGTKPNISTIGADQFDEWDPKEKMQKISFFNWWMFGIFFGTLFANTILIYVQDNVGWGWGYGLPTLGLAISISVFLLGTPFYRHKLPTGSPFLTMARVIVASFRKAKAPTPRDPTRFHEPSSLEYERKGTFPIHSTQSLRYIPPASLSAFGTVSFLVSIVIYDRVLVKIAQKLTGNPRGITLLQRMGIGLIFYIIVMAVASFTERYRLKVAADHGLIHQTGVKLPLTIFVLLPQFVLMGIADAFLVVAKLEFFYDQAPESMKSLGTSYSLTSLGIGNFLSSFLLSTVSKITIKRGRGWILNNLNESRLDYYYLFFALLNFVNFALFLVVVKFYVYRAEAIHSVNVKEEESKVVGIKEDE
ncbi:unnamed protein product [Brassica rapa subsp. narinosa]